jgi:hypothetical protein
MNMKTQYITQLIVQISIKWMLLLKYYFMGREPEGRNALIRTELK